MDLARTSDGRLGRQERRFRDRLRTPVGIDVAVAARLEREALEP